MKPELKDVVVDHVDKEKGDEEKDVEKDEEKGEEKDGEKDDENEKKKNLKARDDFMWETYEILYVITTTPSPKNMYIYYGK